MTKAPNAESSAVESNLPPAASLGVLATADHSRIVADLKSILALAEANKNGKMGTLDFNLNQDFLQNSIPFFAKPGEAPFGLGDIILKHHAAISLLRGTKPFINDTPEVQDLASFIAYANRFKRDGSTIFAFEDFETPSMTALLDYHKENASGEHQAKIVRHSLHYPFPLSQEWKTWWANDAEQRAEKREKPYFTQAEFAEFLEDHANDLIDPPDFLHALFDSTEPDLSAEQKKKTEADLMLEQLATRMHTNFGNARDITALAQGLKVFVEHTIVDKPDIKSGMTEMTFVEVQKNEKGEKLKIPGLFLIAIPVFQNGAAYRMAVRLRYRVAQGKVVWFYQLHRPRETFKHAFDGAAQQVIEETKLPLYRGQAKLASGIGF